MNRELPTGVYASKGKFPASYFVVKQVDCKQVYLGFRP